MSIRRTYVERAGIPIPCDATVLPTLSGRMFENTSGAEITAVILLERFYRVVLQLSGTTESFLRDHISTAGVTPRMMEAAVSRHHEHCVSFLPPRDSDILAELFIFHLHSMNPAVRILDDMVEPIPPGNSSAYDKCIKGIENLLSERGTPLCDGLSIMRCLTAPFREHPVSLDEQLNRVVTLLEQTDEKMQLDDFRRGGDLLREEWRAVSPEPGPPEAPSFSTERDIADLSDDTDWMTDAVMMAKNILVWMAQLSRQYDRPVKTLFDIPDDVFRTFSRRGITILWLIGIWERSPASAVLKKHAGDERAVSSAYAIYDYTVAAELGGKKAFSDFSSRAEAAGIRLACDMVPNHMGVDSVWVREHPEWFLSVEQPPFSAYTYSGPDLCGDTDIEIRIEDHYRDHSDAAVTFEYRDLQTGSVRYIYHGNDGTAMPWNDTAQLDYTVAVVRKQVLDTIISLARDFPVIRFDAAMTLAKREYRRLWFPAPGAGGDIPSRTRCGMTRREFDTVFPREFWHEVVRRVRHEAPNTLLLAEAFWMMEPYFIRTLGMHRVYNSAFMHMIRDGRNAEYRAMLRDIISENPAIAGRFVNFLSNPDEETARDQFGTGPRYIAALVLCITLPGLPLIDHGQIEGFAEKYGMDSDRPVMEECEDVALMKEHERVMFPLLRMRHRFADPRRFRLYDVIAEDNTVAEDVFAWTCGDEDDPFLCVVNNSGIVVHGRVFCSVPCADTSGDEKTATIDNVLLNETPGDTVVFRDVISDEHCSIPRSTLVDRGVLVNLGPYEFHVFADFGSARDDGDITEIERGDTAGTETMNSRDDGTTIQEFAMKNEMKKKAQDLLSFISESPTAFHAVKTIRTRFEAAGFTALDETEPWTLEPETGYYLTRNGSTIIAFRTGKKTPDTSGFIIEGAHTDSPLLKIKQGSSDTSGGALRVTTEVYGGPVLHSWLDRDLSIAGKVMVNDENGPRPVLIDMKRPVAFVPGIAIHLNREVNKGFEYNRQNHLRAVIAGESDSDDDADTVFRKLLADELGVDYSAVGSYDLFLYDVQPGTFSGANEEFFSVGCIDNLSMCHAVTEALLAAGVDERTQVAVFYDNEEIGSKTPMGADSAFLRDVLQRIVNVTCESRDSYHAAVARSFMISADGAHAVHPNFPEKHDAAFAPKMNHGPVIKYSAMFKYATTAETSSCFEEVCASEDIPVQRLANRSDTRSGSTIGPLASSQLGMRAIDVGNPMWAMHSIRETAGVKDHTWMMRALTALYRQ